MVTLKQIAEECQVAVSTVSYVLNDDPRISEETSIRVKEAAKRLGYSMNLQSRKAGNEKNNAVALFLHTMHGPFYGELVYHMQKAFECNGYEMMVCMGDRLKFEKILTGAVVLNPDISDAEILDFADKKIPVITMDRNLHSNGIKNVVLDNQSGVSDITRLLIDKGCKNFCFIAGDSKSYDSQQRYEGYKSALAQAGLRAEDMLFMRSNFTETGGRDIANFVLTKKVLPEAIICANDEMAIGALREIENRGLKIPEQIKLCGFDNTILTEYTTPTLTTVNVDRQKWGSMVAYTLIQMIHGNQLENDLVKIPVNIIERGST